MKITFLGTSHGVPAADRFCSSTLLETGGRVYCIDAGAPVADLLIRRGTPFKAVRGIFLTHMHLDHTAGLVQLCSLANWYYKDSEWDIYFPEERGLKAFQNVVTVCDGFWNGERLQMHVVEEGEVYADERIRIEAIRTRHMPAGQPSYAYRIECEGKQVIFTGDLHGPDASDFPEAAEREETAAIICEMAHFGPEAIFPHVRNCRTGHFFFNHVYHNYDESMAAIKAINGTLPFPVTAVSDGDEYEL